MPRKLVNLTGKKFGKLSVKKLAPKRTRKSGQSPTEWWCECDCGLKCVIVASSDLRKGDSKSCGCIRGFSTKAIDLVGKVFGKLKVIKKGPKELRKGDKKVAEWWVM